MGAVHTDLGVNLITPNGVYFCIATYRIVLKVSFYINHAQRVHHPKSKMVCTLFGAIGGMQKRVAFFIFRLGFRGEWCVGGR